MKVTCPVCRGEVQIQVMLIEPGGGARRRWERASAEERAEQGRRMAAGRKKLPRAGVAQGAEQLPRKQQVAGSTPAASLESEIPVEARVERARLALRGVKLGEMCKHRLMFCLECHGG